jgi:hypothetical protein
MGKKRNQVKRVYPKAVCVPWWSGTNAYNILPDSAPFHERALGRGASPSLAWADAAKRLKAAPKDG